MTAALRRLALRLGRRPDLGLQREAAGMRDVPGVRVIGMAAAGQELALTEERIELGEALDLVRRQPPEQMQRRQVLGMNKPRRTDQLRQRRKRVVVEALHPL